MGFDPYIGFLHGIDYGRQSLALDMTEEFRCPVVDRFTLTLANRNMLRADDFETREGGVYLKRDGLKRYFAEYEKWMTVRDRSGRSFRDVFKAQASAMARAITEGATYQPYRLDG
jgi:CRISPR-associated protein Cas1